MFHATVSIEFQAATLAAAHAGITKIVEAAGPDTNWITAGVRVGYEGLGGRGLVGAAQGAQVQGAQQEAQQNISTAPVVKRVRTPQPTSAPAPADPPADPPASSPTAGAKSKDELLSAIRAVLVPYNDKGAKEKAEVTEFVQGYGKTLLVLTVEQLTAMLPIVQQKFGGAQ